MFGLVFTLIPISICIYGLIRLARADLRKFRRERVQLLALGGLIASPALYWLSMNYRVGYHFGHGAISLDSGAVREYHFIYGAQHPVYRWFFEEPHTYGAWWPQGNPLPPGAVWATEHGTFPLPFLMAFAWLAALMILFKTRQRTIAPATSNPNQSEVAAPPPLP